MIHRLDVFTADREWPPEAVAYPVDLHPDQVIRTRLTAQRLVGSRGIFCAKLSAQLGRQVVCTPEFSQFWSAQASRPRPAFSLEITLPQ